MSGYYIACANSEMIYIVIGSIVGLILLKVIFKLMD